jgi:5-formyltetrahydrofolate cyclo-ligase
MNADLVAAKTALRHQMRARLRAQAPALRETSGVRLTEAIRRLPQWRAAHSVLLFAPLPDEPDLRPLLAAALAEGKRVALPRLAGDASGYLAAAVTDPAHDLLPGAFGIFEPAAHCPVIPLNRLDFLLVPGVAFDRQFRRLGRGKGYYDRLLAGLPGFTCGVGFDFQLVETLPGEPHDVSLNCIRTPSHALFR